MIFGSIAPILRARLELINDNLYRRVNSNQGSIRTSHIQQVINNNQRPVIDSIKIEQLEKLAERFGLVIVIYLNVKNLEEVKHVYKQNKNCLKTGERFNPKSEFEKSANVDHQWIYDNFNESEYGNVIRVGCSKDLQTWEKRCFENLELVFQKIGMAEAEEEVSVYMAPIQIPTESDLNEISIPVKPKSVEFETSDLLRQLSFPKDSKPSETKINSLKIPNFTPDPPEFIPERPTPKTRFRHQTKNSKKAGKKQWKEINIEGVTLRVLTPVQSQYNSQPALSQHQPSQNNQSSWFLETQRHDFTKFSKISQNSQISSNFVKMNTVETESSSDADDDCGSVVDFDEESREHGYRRQQHDYDYYGYGRMSGRTYRNKSSRNVESQLMWKVPTHSIRVDRYQ